MSSEAKPSRETETREATQRNQSWRPPTQFPTPPPVNGVVFHWIRTSIRGVPDMGSVNARFHEGWTPVKAVDYPEFRILADPDSRFEGNIEIGGLLLCRNSAEMMAQRKAFYNTKTQRQMDAVDHNMFKQQDKRVPMYRDRSSRVTVGRKPDTTSKE